MLTPGDATSGGGDVQAEGAAEAGPAYPPGPYGLAVGDVFPLLTLKGYRGGVAPFTSVSTSEYYDPTGSRGIRAGDFGVQAG